MPSSHVVVSAFLGGVLDPRASARIETDAYQQGLLEGVNIEPVHLGGVRRRRGLGYRYLMPNQLTRIASGITPTAPRGGTAANANDDNTATVLTTVTAVSTLDPYIVVHYDLGSAKAVLFADVIGIVSDSGSSTQFAIQYSTDNITFVTLGSALPAIDTTSRSYRRAGPITARYWRVAKIGGTDMGGAHISIADFNLLQDSGTVSEGREMTFEVATDERYVAVFTDRAVTIFNGDTGALVDRAPMPYVSADLAELDAAANVESMLLVHEDYAPRFLVRESTTNFQTFTATFTNIPQIDFADSSSPAATSDVQIITFDANWQIGDTFQISLDGAKSAAITYAGDIAQTADSIEREVQKMWVVKAFSGVSCARTALREFTLTFGAASADSYGDLSVTALSHAGTTGVAAVNHSVVGVSRRENMWSATRGYPRSAEFFEGRLYLGGTRSRQQSLIGSVVNDILQLDTAEGLDDDALVVTLNGRQLNAINGLYGGRSLQMFTTGGEFRYVKEQGVPITPSDTPVNQTQYGSAKIRPVSIDGATIYIQRNRKSVRDFRFDYTENAYNSLGISSLAAHLIYDVKDLAAWNGSAVDEISLVFVVNGTNPLRADAAANTGVMLHEDGTTYDAAATPNASPLVFPHGTVAVFNSRKESNVQAWTIWTTQGEFKAVATVLQEIFFLVKRTVNGVVGLYFEQADRDLYTDCAVQVTNSPASAAVAGLSHLNGEECRVRADGFVLENVTPVAGAATIQQAGSEIEVGLDWTPAVTPMPLQTFVAGQSSNLMRKKRVVKVRARVRNTLGLLCNGRVLPDRYFDIDSFDEAATPYTGTHSLEESTNWDEQKDKLVRFTQVDPLPFELLGIDVQLEVS